jgi:hypothetical protein
MEVRIRDKVLSSWLRSNWYIQNYARGEWYDGKYGFWD